MVDEQHNDRSRGPLERLRRALYTHQKPLQAGERTPLHPHDIEKHAGWSETGAEQPISAVVPRPRASFVKKFFIASVIFFAVSLAVAAFIMLGGANIISTRNVDIAVVGPVSASAGELLTLDITVGNNNSVPLEATDLIVEYPEGTRTGAQGDELLRTRTALGVIAPGAVVKKTVNAVFFGQEGDEKTMRVSLEYRTEGSNAIFVAEGSYAVLISSAPIRLTLTALREVSAGQEMVLKATVASNATEVVRDILLAVDYPFGFSFTDGAPKPVFGKNVWQIGDLPPGAERSITVRGVLEGQDGEEKVFRVKSGTPNPKDPEAIGIAYALVTETVTIARPFLGLETFLDGQPTEPFITQSGRPMSVDIFWTNNVPTKLTDVVIEAQLSGNALDESSVDPQNGFYDSVSNTVLWDKTTDTRLSALEPGARGKVTFRFAARSLVGAGGALVADPTLSVKVAARGKRLSDERVEETVRSSDDKTILVTSDVTLSQRAVYSSGPFANSGPLPPQAEKETTYTVIWTVVNTSNAVARGTVRAALPLAVRWLERTSPSSEDIRYNATDRSLVWNLGRISRGAGVTAAPREVAFQIALLPSTSQVNTAPTLVSQAAFSGTDEFTQTVLETSSRAADTALSTDPLWRNGQELVTQ